MSLLTCRDLSLGYDGRVVLSDVNFTVEKGDYLCVVGENGSGKSTLIKGLLRLKTPLSGDILVGDGLRQNEIGYLPQQTDNQRDFPAGVWEVVLSGRLHRLGARPFYSRADREAARRTMETLGILPLKHRCFSELSGGQQQRVLLARALCATGSLLLLDEPAAGLDPLVTAELYHLIVRLNREEDLTVIMVTHDMHMVAHHATKVLHLGQTQLFFGDADAYRQSDVGQRFFGGGSCV